MRRHYLDNIRWITIICVVIYHVIYMFNGVATAGVIGPFYEVQYQDAIQYILYSVYKNLLQSLKYRQYKLRSVSGGFITNIGNYDRQYPYRETDFFRFDQFLFTTWKNKPRDKGKDKIPWGIKLD